MFQLDEQRRQKHEDLASKIAFIFLLAVWVIGSVWFIGQILRYSGVYSDLALYEPSKNEGINNATQLIQSLEKYKQKHGTYPLNIAELLDDSTTYIPHVFSYEYEVITSRDNQRAYFLSFRKRWSLNGWHCYYSEDMNWLTEKGKCSAETRFSQSK